MGKSTYRIGVVAPGAPIDTGIQTQLLDVVRALDLSATIDIHVHPHCLIREGHFAGSDEVRARAFLDIANDPAFDALWVARGGYGACRILESVVPMLTDVAKAKTYLGYSDAGFLLGALYKAGFPHVAHGPMPADLLRDGGKAAIERALAYLITRDDSTLEPSIHDDPVAAFNITILNNLLGTSYAPDLSDHVLMLEEVSEYHYAIDRMMFHITSHETIRQVAGIRLGRCSDVPENDYPFGMTVEEIVQYWCARSGIAYLGRADIGHDSDNKIVVFGRRLIS